MKGALEKLGLLSLSLVLLLGLEGGLRLVGYGSSHQGVLDFGIPVDDDIYVEDAGRPGWMVVAPWLYEMQRAARRPLINEDTFPRHRPDGELRIIATGESAVFGYPTGGELAFPHRLGELIRARHPDLRVRVINAGVPGYDARRSAKVVQEVLRYEPSLVILYTGHNEYLRRFTMENLRNLHWTVRLRQQLYRLRFYQLLMSVLRPITGRAFTGQVDVGDMTDEFEKHEGFRQPRTEFETRLVEERYRHHVEQAVRSAQDAGVPLVLCTVVSNLKAFPKHTTFDADTSPEDQEAAVKLRFEMKRLLKKGRIVEVEPLAREALAIVPRHAQFHHYLALSLEEQGRLDDALEHYTLAREYEATQRRGGLAFHRAIRDLADEDGVTVVDLAQMFRADLEHGHWGEQLFSDYCHPNEAGRDVIAEAIYGSVDWESLPR